MTETRVSRELSTTDSLRHTFSSFAWEVRSKRRHRLSFPVAAMSMEAFAAVQGIQSVGGGVSGQLRASAGLRAVQALTDEVLAFEGLVLVMHRASIVLA